MARVRNANCLQADALARELAGDGSGNSLSSSSVGTIGASVASESAEDAVALRRMEQMQGIVSAVVGHVFARCFRSIAVRLSVI
eukprot:COSAG02_NODE_591_length_19862_cov_8.047918_2_plen_84_part_00